LSFHAFGNQHLITLGVIGIVCLITGFIAAKIESSRIWLGRFLGLLLASYMVAIYLRQAFVHALTWEDSLPLELCNLVLFACIISLFRPNRLTSEIAYFWGLGGVLQATLTPDLSANFPSWDFMLFFWGHGATLVAIIFLLSGQKFRPGKKSIMRMMIALNCYALIVGVIDAAAGWNYGYLCRKPGGASLYDFLGPWPWYLLSLEAVALLLFLVFDLPWAIGRSIIKKSQSRFEARS
jgi:hypothetical integral membrane protein (TIGR02206 family)